MRLDAFLVENRADIIERCRVKVSARRAPRPTAAELERGIPLFLDQLVETLRLHTTNPDHDAAATGHGRDLMNSGFTIAQVVHDYGDVCQSVTDLAIERAAPISNALPARPRQPSHCSGRSSNGATIAAASASV
jgi:hypothetical protein